LDLGGRNSKWWSSTDEKIISNLKKVDYVQYLKMYTPNACGLEELFSAVLPTG
jgi:hypothetical protein